MPQASTLRPLLFLIMMNDLANGRTALVFAYVTTLLSRGDYGDEQTRVVADHDFEEAKIRFTENKNLLLNNNKT